MLKKKKEVDEEEEFVELTEEPTKETKIKIRIEKLKSYADVERIQQLLRENTIVFLNIKELRSKDINELKKATETLKKTITAMDGDIVGVDEEFLILTPRFGKVFRGK